MTGSGRAAATPDRARRRFDAAVDAAAALIRDGERFALRYREETSDFARINHGRIRQIGNVRQPELDLSLGQGRRSANAVLTLSGATSSDRAALADAIASLRATLAHVPEDPFAICDESSGASEDIGPDRLPATDAALGEVAAASGDADLVGIWASGAIVHGTATSFGRRDWHSRHTFNFDWSLHGAGETAVKGTYAGEGWESARIQRDISRAKADLERLGSAPRRLTPGKYRAYLAPAALAELLGLLAYGAFGFDALHSGSSPLVRLREGTRRVDSRVQIREDHAGGLSPRVTAEGFPKPDSVVLVEGGRLRDPLVDARASAEFAVAVNADSPRAAALHMAPGTLAADAALAALGTGLWIGNVWYCNFSERGECRITGTTRFACFYVEDGVPVAPIETMRFDESLYHMLGDGLEAIGAERTLFLDPDTYARRSSASLRVPGILVDGFNLAL